MKLTLCLFCCLMLEFVRSEWVSFYGRDYFLELNTKGSRYYAERKCREMNSTLATMKHLATRKLLTDFAYEASKEKPYCYYFGLSRIPGTEKFQWVDGSVLNMSNSNWAPREPNNKRYMEPDNVDCVVMGRPSRKQLGFPWYDMGCMQTCGFFCQRILEDVDTGKLSSRIYDPFVRNVIIGVVIGIIALLVIVTVFSVYYYKKTRKEYKVNQ